MINLNSKKNVGLHGLYTHIDALYGGHHSICGGGGLEVFLINNFGRTLREINDLLQELFYINM